MNSEGLPTLGFGIDTSPALARFNPLNLLEGRWPAADDEVVIDAGTADEQGYEVGDTVEISTLQPKRAIRGRRRRAVRRGRQPRGDQLRRLHDSRRAGAARPRGPVRRDLRRRRRRPLRGRSRHGDPARPARRREVVSATAEAQEQADEVSDFTSIFRYFLLAFAAIALFVGAFVIFNTFSITVAQRTREFATLRTIGASRRQVLGSVILESLVIGLLASLVGLGLGVVLAEGIEALFGSLGVDLPSADRVFATRTVVVSLVVGVGITLLAGLFPAIRATRVPPIAAVREGATLPQVAVRAVHALGRRALRRRVAAPARARDVHRRARHGRSAAVDRRRRAPALPRSRDALVAARDADRGRRRPAGATRRRCGRAAGERQLRAQPGPDGCDGGRADDRYRARLLHRDAHERDEGVEPRGDRGAGGGRLRRDLARRVHAVRRRRRATRSAASSGPEVVTSVRSDGGLVDGDTTEIGGIEPDTIADAYVFDWKDGDDSVLATLGRTRRSSARTSPRTTTSAVGDMLTIRSTADRSARVTVVGTFEPPPFYPLIESVNVSTQLFDSLYDRPRNRWTWANVAGEPTDGSRAQLETGDLRLPRHAARDACGVDRPRGRGLQRVHLVPLRDAHARRLREHLRDDQHARPLRLRADARDRDAARDRDDPAPGAADDPAGEHHHGAHRRRDRAAARHLPRRARQPRAVASSTCASRSRGCSSSCSRSSRS